MVGFLNCVLRPEDSEERKKGIPSKENRKSEVKEVGEHGHVISRMMEVQYSCRGVVYHSETNGA